MKLKLKTAIPARKFACPDGPIKAEGTSAATPFCYRLKVTEKAGQPRKTAIELHSRITGRKIGYIGINPGKFLVPKRSQARVWIESTKIKQGNTPKAVEEKMWLFIKTAQKDLKDQQWTPYNRHSQETWDKIVSEAKKK